MKNDIQPSIVCALFTTSKAFDNFKIEMKKQGLNYRELKLIDIGIPLETEEYEKTVNFLRKFTRPILKRFVQNMPFKSFVMKALGKVHLDPFDYDNYKDEHDFKHPLTFAGFTPLFIDMKYKNEYSDEEKINLERLKTFSNKTWKPTPLKEQGIFEDKDMTKLKDSDDKKII